jgi:hypothetical protein
MADLVDKIRVVECWGNRAKLRVGHHPRCPLGELQIVFRSYNGLHKTPRTNKYITGDWAMSLLRVNALVL